MKTPCKLIIVLCMAILLTGCWDLIELDQYFFISTIGIDTYNPEENAADEVEREVEGNEISKENRFVVTYVAPDLRAIGKNATSDKPRIVMASISSNPYETTKELATRTTRNFTFRHTKVVLLGEEIAKNREYMKEILDNLGRHDQLSRKLNVLVVKGTAKEVINIEDPFEPETGYLINQIIGKKQGSSRYNDMVLEEILTELYFSGNALFPRAIPGKGEVKVGGSGIVKDFKLVGWLEDAENISAMFLMNRVSTAVINIVHENAIVPYVITNSHTKNHVTMDGDKIKYTVNITTEGYIQQYKLGAKEKITDQKTIMNIENELEDTLSKQIRATFNKLQKEFKVDALGLGRNISKYNPKLWDDIKDDWEDIFPDIEFEINVDARLRRIGMTK
ncbi:Ger(x)C family spore germination protein [Proteiniborus sp. MB09-C3]|uniref:Ger(x)C family spore germination protein n=1 Tax=Proteiniborus sp. MB09-C3 TaxID=3050072 RepID=UPI002553B233|nr:Ger(x)C family spore germination protein [Proteiniborus sp. MB09-C3]WIV12271.1 Ger(x)C family spore germination protein [Proteiniborus sp. MB09-C3]